MANEMVVLQGNTFTVELQSRLGSTCFGWALTGLPKGIALLSVTDYNPSPRLALHNHKFEFGAISATDDNAEIEFTMIDYAGLKPTETKHTVIIKVIPSDSEEFVKYSENSDQALRDVCNSAMPYGLVMSSPEAALKYGFPCRTTPEANVMYGYTCGLQNAIMPYGYPPPYTLQESAVKYGYPCGVQDASQEANLKYGYPCGVQDASQEANLKYGYPCGVQDTQCKQGVALKYGFPCRTAPEANIMYGYTCGLQNANMPYGFPPPYTLQESAVKYGYPCGVQDASQDVAFKYGYPCGVQDAQCKQGVGLKYGYPCGQSEPLLKYGFPEPLLKYGFPCK